MATSRNEARVILSAEDRSSAAFASFNKSLGGLSAGAATLRSGVAGLVAGLSVGALSNFARTTLNAVDALNDVADATGSTVENISALEDVALRTGANLEAVSSILVKFNAVLADAKPNQGAGAVIKALNLDIEALKRLDPGEALRQVAVALAGYADNGDKARAVQELFGKSVKEAAPFLKDLAESGALNARVTTEQALEVEKFNKELFKLQTNANNAARVITMDLVSSINQLYGALDGSGETSKLSASLAVPLQTASVLGANLAFVIKGIATEIGGIAAQAAAVARLDFRGAVSIGDMMKSDAKEARAAFDALEQRLLQIGKTTSQSFQQSSAESARLMRQGAAPTLRIPEAPSATPRAAAGARSARAEVVRPDLELDAISAEFDRLYDQRDDRARRAAQIYQELLTPVERLAQKEAELDALRSAGLISEETLSRARMQAADEYAEAMDRATGKTAEAVELVDELSQASLQAAERMQDALGDQLFNALDGRFSDIGDAFGNMIKRMVAEALSADIMNALFGAVRTSSSGVNSRGGGFLGDIGSALLGFLPSFAGGGYTGSGARAGGMDGQGGYLAMLHPRETVVDHTKGGGMAAPVINIYNTIGSVASQADVVAGMQQTRAQIMGELQRSRTYGGAAA